MNKRIVTGISILALLTTITMAWAGTASAPFRIEVVVDTTLFMPDLCENGGTIEGTLEFHPGITTLDDPEAMAIDTCATDTIGDWNVTMAGNVNLDLSFRLSADPGQGITVAIDNQNLSPYTSSTSYVNLTTTDVTPAWAQNVPDGSTLNIWQRVAADTTALGGSIHDLSIIITSSQAA